MCCGVVCKRVCRLQKKKRGRMITCLKCVFPCARSKFFCKHVSDNEYGWSIHEATKANCNLKRFRFLTTKMWPNHKKKTRFQEAFQRTGPRNAEGGHFETPKKSDWPPISRQRHSVWEQKMIKMQSSWSPHDHLHISSATSEVPCLPTYNEEQHAMLHNEGEGLQPQ